VRTVAWLHDVVEDTTLTLSDLVSAGFPPQVVEAVDRLTKREGEDYYEAIERVMEDHIARAVKLADLTHNLSDLPMGHQRDKYLLAKRILEMYPLWRPSSFAPGAVVDRKTEVEE